MKARVYRQLKAELVRIGFADEVKWAENIKPPVDAIAFATEIIYVICNSGMKAQVARPIFRRVMACLRTHMPSSRVFRHKGKTDAIDDIWRLRHELFEEWRSRDDAGKLEFIGDLPWIGEITKWHVAKNFGMAVCKPDRHLVRIADAAGSTPDELCRRLSEETGDGVPLVDTVIWRACNLGLA